MNKNTRKFIWHGLWGFMFLGGVILMLAVADSLWGWALFGINVIFSALHLQKVEQTLKED